MSELSDDDKQRLVTVARIQWRTPRTTVLDTIEAVLSELRALGYSLSKQSEPDNT